MKSFWLVDFADNQQLIQDVEEFPKFLSKEDILEEIKNHSGNFYTEKLRNRLVINSANESKWYTTGSVKFGLGIIWIYAYKITKDFEINKDYEKIYLKEHIQSYSKAIPLDNLK